MVSFSILTPFGPRRCSAQAHRRAPVLRALQILRAAAAFTHGRRMGEFRETIAEAASLCVTYERAGRPEVLPLFLSAG